MGTVTDPTADAVDREERVASETVSSVDPGRDNDAEANPKSSGNGSNGVRVSKKDETRTLPAIEFSPAPPRIHRGQSAGTGLFSFLSGGVAIPRGGSENVGGIPRHGSGSNGGIPRHGSGTVGGIPRYGSGSVGGIHRGRSGVHLPSLSSISFSMSRLPEEDAGLQMHFTETKEVETLDESPRAMDNDDAPPRKKNRMRKHLTAVGACSFGFRLSECVLSLIVIIVMCSNSQHMGAGFGTLKFNHFQAYK